MNDNKNVADFVESLEKHKFYVKEAGIKLGLPLSQLLAHDMSKYSDAEFGAYVRQFHGKADDFYGFQNAWLHHIHNNPHHPEHWVVPKRVWRNTELIEVVALPMPERYSLEMVADWMGASMAYTGSFDMSDWLTKNYKRFRFHPETVVFVDGVLDDLGYSDIFGE